MTTTRIHTAINRRLKAIGLGVALGLTIGAPAQAVVDISNLPLFLTASVEPNLMFVLDDSGSMQWELTPDEFVLPYFVFSRVAGTYGGGSYPNYTASVRYNATNANERATARFARASAVNRSYYDPSVTYRPWVNQDGTSYPNAVPTAAFHHPIRTGLGSRNLTVDNTDSAIWVHRSATSAFYSISNASNSLTHYPAVYFNYNGAGVYDANNYTMVEIRSTTATYSGDGRASRTDCTAGVCTYAQEIQNFANWYTYYRSRVLASQAAIGRAFSGQGEGMRVGFGAINKGSTSIDSVDTRTIINGVRHFSGTDRQTFFNNLYNHVIPTSVTPLRRALDDAGQYFSRTDNRGPWGDTPGNSTSGAHLQCRQNYTILMTDGYWNGDEADTSNARNNNDGTGGPTITGPNSQTFTFNAVSPFVDSYSNTLADVAMYYWKRDLRTDLVNEVPVTTINPAFWQHMVTFGVGLGVTGTINPTTAFNAIGSGASVTWPDPDVTNPAKLDDLLHASVNGRGGFFSASDPTTFATELSNVLSSIVARVESSSTSAAASSATLQSSTLLYTAGFRSTDWTGQFIARNIIRGTNGTLSLGSTAWDAEVQLRAQAAAGTRNIFTSTRDSIIAGTQILSGTGVALNGTLSTNQTAALNKNTAGIVDNLASNRISWLYGNDAAHSSFRKRNTEPTTGALRLLGDIINSNPQFTGKRDFGYRRLSDVGASYLTYRTSSSYLSRPDMLYVGANDGMLHAFNAQTGDESFAYVPSELLIPEGSNTFAKINPLIDPSYTHRYLVDGTVTTADAYWGGSWKSVMVGSMGAGGRTVFALNVTSPGSFSTSNILWEFTDPDLGYGSGKPTIVRMSNGDWAAVFGNGYNSANNKSVLFVVRLSDGQLLAKINTNQGDDTAASPNGLAAPTVALNVDTLSANTIYAGDLKGRLWRFDVSGNTSTWDSSSKRKVLFQAKDSGGTNQPITSAPEVALNPDDPSQLVITFGTGSYFRNQDSNSTQVQSLYGIIDDNGTAVTGRSELAGQTITWQGNVTIDGTSYTLREVSDNPIGTNKGWYIDLIFSGNAQGERVVSKPVLLTGAVRDRVRFTTMIPDPDPCGTTGGRTGFLMDVMLATGGRAGEAVFDLNDDGQFDGDDLASCTDSCSGIQFGGGEELIVIQDGENPDLGHVCSGEGNCEETREPGTPVGRQSWRQLR